MNDYVTPVIAAASALAGATITAVINARSERRREQALERQQLHEERVRLNHQLRDLQADHQRWLRDRRHEAYRALIDSMYDTRRALNEHWASVAGADFDAQHAMTCQIAASKQLSEIQALSRAVQLDGPANVADITDAYWTQLWKAHLLMVDCHERRTRDDRATPGEEDQKRVRQTLRDLEKVQGHFTRTARDVLSAWQLPSIGSTDE
ncbi:hypothetical protein [Microbispora sp. NBC_01389]|uniref:hypothetical protein n=1 Tax=Microbispora sp. NBC_01389 TaxID=2903584 RepID=UPI003247A65B